MKTQKKSFKLMIVLVNVIYILICSSCKQQGQTKQVIQDILPEHCETTLFLSDSIFYTKAYCRALEKSRGSLEVKIPYENSYFSRIFGYHLFGGASKEDLEEMIFFLREDKETGLYDISFYDFYSQYDTRNRIIMNSKDRHTFSHMVRKYFYYDEHVAELFGIEMKDSINFKNYKDLILCTKDKLEKKHKNSTHIKRRTININESYKGYIPHKEFLQYNKYSSNDSLTNINAVAESFIIDYGFTNPGQEYTRRDDKGKIHWAHYNEDVNEKQISIYYSLVPFNGIEYYKKYIRKEE